MFKASALEHVQSLGARAVVFETLWLLAGRQCDEKRRATSSYHEPLCAASVNTETEAAFRAQRTREETLNTLSGRNTPRETLPSQRPRPESVNTLFSCARHVRITQRNKGV